MIVIDDIIISDDVVEKHFVCDLARCKGACCVEGDGAAPLEETELEELDQYYDDIKPFLTRKGIAAIEKMGKYVFEDEKDYTGYGTPLVGNTGACAYVTFDNDNIAQCRIENAYQAVLFLFRNPSVVTYTRCV